MRNSLVFRENSKAEAKQYAKKIIKHMIATDKYQTEKKRNSIPAHRVLIPNRLEYTKHEVVQSTKNNGRPGV